MGQGYIARCTRALTFELRADSPACMHNVQCYLISPPHAAALRPLRTPLSSSLVFVVCSPFTYRLSIMQPTPAFDTIGDSAEGGGDSHVVSADAHVLYECCTRTCVVRVHHACISAAPSVQCNPGCGRENRSPRYRSYGDKATPP